MESLLQPCALTLQTTLGTGAHLERAILGQTEIMLQTGASVNGWLLISPEGSRHLNVIYF